MVGQGSLGAHQLCWSSDALTAVWQGDLRDIQGPFGCVHTSKAAPTPAGCKGHGQLLSIGGPQLRGLYCRMPPAALYSQNLLILLLSILFVSMLSIDAHHLLFAV